MDRPSLPVIFCPLEIEAKAARKVVAPACEFIRTGPGPEAIRRALEHHDLPPGSTAILFGTAGGLAQIGVACRASQIIDEGGRSWDAAHTRGVTIVGVNAPVCSALEKQALARRIGAAVVDCESHVFAPFAIERGWKWAIVRAITDDARTDLSPEIVNWAGDDGRTRMGRVVSSMLRDPRLIPESIRLGRRTARALRAAGLLLRSAVDELAQTPTTGDPS